MENHDGHSIRFYSASSDTHPLSVTFLDEQLQKFRDSQLSQHVLAWSRKISPTSES